MTNQPAARGHTARPAGDRPVRRLLDLVLIAVWVGLASGAIYGLTVAFRRFVLGRLVWHHKEALWMAPVAQTVVFLVVGLLLVPVALAASRRRARAVAIGLYGFLGAVSIMLPYEQIARWAMLILAAGVAVQAVRMDRALSPRGRRRLALVAGSSVALLLGLGLGRRGQPDGRRPDPPGQPSEARGVNVLLIVLDTVRDLNLSLYGYDRPTSPALERWAARGTVFDRAIAPSSWTLPSHATLLTGQIGSASGGGWLEPVRLGGANLPDRFDSLGYATGGFVANLLYTSFESGLADRFSHYEDYPLTPYQVLLHSPLVQTGFPRALVRARSLADLGRAVSRFRLRVGRYPADEYKPAPAVTDGFLAWHSGLDGQPFFAMLNYFDAHGPYRAPAEYLRRFRREGGTLDRYDAAIAFLDDELDRLFRTLERRGALESTLVVVTSDHGELFGEHGMKGHANALYRPLIEVPLVIMLPQLVPAGIRVAAPVSLVDVAATILDLSGHPQTGTPGTSLARWWSDSATVAVPAFAELITGRNVDSTQRNATTWLQSVVDGRYQLVRDGNHREELLDWETDSDGVIDVRRHRALQPTVTRLRELLDRHPPPE